jgi:hypothetical protein
MSSSFLIMAINKKDPLDPPNLSANQPDPKLPMVYPTMYMLMVNAT